MAGAERMCADGLGSNRVGVEGVGADGVGKSGGSVLEYQHNDEVCASESLVSDLSLKRRPKGWLSRRYVVGMIVYRHVYYKKTSLWREKGASEAMHARLCMTYSNQSDCCNVFCNGISVMEIRILALGGALHVDGCEIAIYPRIENDIVETMPLEYET
jgi:hypothetical protein